MSELEELIVHRIRRQGPIPFAAYMQLALYHGRDGYYSSGRARVGPRGDYVTSPELDPAFGLLWSRGFEAVWAACDRPARFDVVEIGPGEGSFAAAVLESARGAFARALDYHLVERAPALVERQRARLGKFDRVDWIPSLAEVPRLEAGCIFANEVLDNLPVHLVQRADGELREVCVDVGDGSLQTTLLPPSTPQLGRWLERVGVELEEGQRFEIALAADSLVAHAAQRLVRGALVFVDYGDDAPGLSQRAGGTLLAYSSRGVDDRVLEDPGTKDITSHANWTAVRQACEAAGLEVRGPIPQRLVLRALGLEELHLGLRREHHEAVANGRAGAAVRALSRRQALGALADPGGLGGLGVIVGLAGIAQPAFLRE